MRGKNPAPPEDSAGAGFFILKGLSVDGSCLFHAQLGYSMVMIAFFLFIFSIQKVHGSAAKQRQIEPIMHCF